MESNKIAIALEEGKNVLYKDGDDLMFARGNVVVDVNRVAGMFASKRWSKSDIVGQRFSEAEQASGVPYDEIQKALETDGVFAYTPTSKGKEGK